MGIFLLPWSLDDCCQLGCCEKISLVGWTPTIEASSCSTDSNCIDLVRLIITEFDNCKWRPWSIPVAQVDHGFGLARSQLARFLKGVRLARRAFDPSLLKREIKFVHSIDWLLLYWANEKHGRIRSSMVVIGTPIIDSGATPVALPPRFHDHLPPASPNSVPNKDFDQVQLRIYVVTVDERSSGFIGNPLGSGGCVPPGPRPLPR